MHINSHKSTEALRLRAHHICCIQFWNTEFEERGTDFLRVQSNIKRVLRSQPDSPIVVIEGVDELCQQCPLRGDERCNSPLGGEEEVRKWDAKLLKELNSPFGTCLASREWQALIKEKIPFTLCQRCQWKQVCSVGAELL